MQGPEVEVPGAEKKEPAMEVGCARLSELKGHWQKSGFCPQYNLNRYLEGGVRYDGVFSSWHMTLGFVWRRDGDGEAEQQGLA